MAQTFVVRDALTDEKENAEIVLLQPAEAGKIQTAIGLLITTDDPANVDAFSWAVERGDGSKAFQGFGPVNLWSALEIRMPVGSSARLRVAPGGAGRKVRANFQCVTES